MTPAGLNTLSKTDASRIGDLFAGMTIIRPAANFVRIMDRHYAGNPLSFGHGSSRFSPVHPSTPPPAFGLIYAAADLATACYEAVVRDKFDGTPVRILRPADYQHKAAVNISTAPGQDLRLLDLCDGNAARHSVPTDVIRYSKHTDGQHFSEFVYTNRPDIDGFLYGSRFTEIRCIAVYDRAIVKLTSPGAPLALSARVLAPTLSPWNIQVL